MPPQRQLRFRQIGVRGPSDKSLRPVTLPFELGVFRPWRTNTPLGVHVAMKRWLLLGTLTVRSFVLPEKKPARGAPTATARMAKRRVFYSTAVRTLPQTFEHGGVPFTVGQIGR